MASSFSLIALFSLVLFAGIIEARNYPGEYWQRVAENDEAEIEVTKQLVQMDSALSDLKKLTTSEKKSFVKDFEPRPNVSAYGDDSKLKEDTSFLKDFETRHSATSYGDDAKLQKDKSFIKYIKPRVNPCANGDGVGVKRTQA